MLHASEAADFIYTDVMINFASKKFRDDIIKKNFKFIQDIKNTAYEDKLKSA